MPLAFRCYVCQRPWISKDGTTPMVLRNGVTLCTRCDVMLDATMRLAQEREDAARDVRQLCFPLKDGD